MLRNHRLKLSAAAAAALLSPLIAQVALAQKSGDIAFGEQEESRRVRVSVDVQAGFDDNVYTTSQDEEESFFTSLGGSVSAELGDSRTQVSLSLGGSATYYPDRTGDDMDYAANFSGAIFHDLNERFDIFANTSIAYEVEPDYGDVLVANRRDGDYFYTNTNVGLNSQWTQRFSTVSTLNFASISYQDSEFADQFDRIEYGSSTALRFALKPETLLVAEYRNRKFDSQEDSRDALSHYFLAGVDHGFSERLKVTVRGGAELRDFDSVGSQSSPYAETSLSYLGSKNSSIAWITRYGYEVSDTADADERKTFRSGVQWNQGITAKLRSDLALFYQHNEFTGNESDDLSFDEDVFSINAGLTYTITRNLLINAGYMFTTVSADAEYREYDRNRYNVGMRFTF